MTRAERGWLAGIIDGEGSICCQWKTFGGRWKIIQPRVSIYNNNPKVIQQAKRLLEELVGSIPKILQNSRGNYSASVTRSEDVVLVLKRLLPDLIGKRDQAIILIEHFDGRPDGRTIDDAERPARLKKDEKIFERVRQLNARYNSWYSSSVETVREASQE